VIVSSDRPLAEAAKDEQLARGPHFILHNSARMLGMNCHSKPKRWQAVGCIPWPGRLVDSTSRTKLVHIATRQKRRKALAAALGHAILKTPEN